MQPHTHDGKLLSRGVDAYTQGDLVGARRAFEEAVRRAPDSTAALCNLAGVLGSMGEYAASVATFERALEHDPELAEAMAGLAWALPMAGRDRDVPALVRRWVAVAPEDPIATHLAASFGHAPAPTRCSTDYIESFFDGFADSYDETLEDLAYRAPRQIGRLLPHALGEPRASIDIIDAGCGTGLCGPIARPFAQSLVGLDLSKQMLVRAHARRVYDELVHVDLVAGLKARTGEADAVVSADVLVYFGDLVAPFRAAANALRPGGALLATVECGGDDGYALAETGRYVHAEAYVRGALADAGFDAERADTVRLRFDRGQPVAGLAFIGRKPSASPRPAKPG